jgi:hypothetical protein
MIDLPFKTRVRCSRPCESRENMRCWG